MWIFLMQIGDGGVPTPNNLLKYLGDQITIQVTLHN